MEGGKEVGVEEGEKKEGMEGERRWWEWRAGVEECIGKTVLEWRGR